MAELLYGQRIIDGESVSIDDVLSGSDCNCICPQCKAPLVARKGKIREHHFAHKGNVSDCNIIYANQTALHRMAKAIIAEEKKISVPAVAVPLKNIKLGRIPPGIRAKLPKTYEYRPAEILICQSVDLEKHLPGFVPDIIANSSSNGEYLIEIAVTHFVDEEKKARAVEYNAPMLEIDLSRFVEEPISSDELREMLIASNKLRVWTYHPDFDEAEKQAQSYYENLQIIKDYRKQQQEKKAAERRKKEIEERQHQLQLKREELRTKRIDTLLQPQNYASELKRLRIDDTALQKVYDYNSKDFRFYKDHKQIPWFIDIPITGEMVFQRDRRIWQGIIFNRYIYGRNEEHARINTDLIFSALKDDHKIPINWDLASKFGREVIRRYIWRLESLGFIATDTFPHNWCTVMARATITPPDEATAIFLQGVLEKIDLYSPDVNELITAKIRERDEQLRIEKEKQLAQQRLEKEQKAKEEAAIRAKGKYNLGKEEVKNQDFNQEKQIRDRFGYRWLFCTDCNQICREDDMSSYQYAKGQCRNCSRKN